MDRETIKKGFELCANGKPCMGEKFTSCPFSPRNNAEQNCGVTMARNAIALLKEQDSLLGIQQTADAITFLSTGTAQQGEERGIMLGKSLMHEWIYKELLHRGLLTDEIRLVFEQAKRI